MLFGPANFLLLVRPIFHGGRCYRPGVYKFPYGLMGIKYMYSYLSIADLFSDGEITALSFGEGFKKRKKGLK